MGRGAKEERQRKEEAEIGTRDSWSCCTEASKEAVYVPTARMFMPWPWLPAVSVAIPTLVFHSAVTRTTGASRDQVRGVGGLDPASQLLAPATYRSTVYDRVYHMRSLLHSQEGSDYPTFRSLNLECLPKRLCKAEIITISAM
jgi:hypothetical protein